MAPTFRPGLNFITFNDLTPRANFLWVSSSIEDCLGYTPEEVVDSSPYDLVVLEDITPFQAAHTEHILNDMVASQALARYRHKDGHSVPVLVIGSVCHEFIVGCIIPLDDNGEPCEFTSNWPSFLLRDSLQYETCVAGAVVDLRLFTVVVCIS